MTELQDAADPRVETFARFMQARDARTYEVQDTNEDYQTWDGIGEMGREEYLKDAAAYVAALDIIDPSVSREQVDLAVGSVLFNASTTRSPPSLTSPARTSDHCGRRSRMPCSPRSWEQDGEPPADARG